MSSKLHRFEILFPQQYNDGRVIPRKLRGRTLKEIVDEFGAASFEPTNGGELTQLLGRIRRRSKNDQAGDHRND
jgi:hypothetical protein